MYPFSVYSFSEKEIEQICQLARCWASGDIWLPIDARTYTRQVKEYALNWFLLERRDDGRLYFTSGYLFNVLHNLPIEALWRLVQPMLVDGYAGYSIVNNRLWTAHFGIDTQDSRHANENDLRDKEALLLKLDTCGYIHFLMAGNIWSIHTKERRVR